LEQDARKNKWIEYRAPLWAHKVALQQGIQTKTPPQRAAFFIID
jgi:hypothetical protein